MPTKFCQRAATSPLTRLPPASVAAALAALDVIEAEPERVVRPVANATQFCREVGLPTPESPIVPVIIGEETRALDASRLLLDEGYLVTAIRPPTVPVGTARLRITLTANHSPEQVSQLTHSLKSALQAQREVE